MPKTIHVKLLSPLPDEKGELYSCFGPFKKVYMRQPTHDNDYVRWFNVSKWNGDYEAGTPLPAGITVNVYANTARRKQIALFAETTEVSRDGSPCAIKQGHFFFEQVQHIVCEHIKDMHLHTSEQWSKWLLRDAVQHAYSGQPDNWLHFCTVLMQSETLEIIQITGVKYVVTSTTWKHTVSDKTWNVIEIRDAGGHVVAVSGYQYVE